MIKDKTAKPIDYEMKRKKRARNKKKKKAKTKNEKEMKTKSEDKEDVDERRPKESKDTPQKRWGPVSSIPHGGRKDKYVRQAETANDVHEVTDEEEKDSANGWADPEAWMLEGTRLKPLANRNKRARKKNKAEMRKKEMKKNQGREGCR